MLDFVSNYFSNPNPIVAAMGAAALALMYFVMMTINPNLPPAIIFSLIIGYFVYMWQMGKLQPSVAKQELPQIKN